MQAAIGERRGEVATAVHELKFQKNQQSPIGFMLASTLTCGVCGCRVIGFVEATTVEIGPTGGTNTTTETTTVIRRL